MRDDQILDLLEHLGGAVLCWQVTCPNAWRSAAARDIIEMDYQTDCYVHPDAIAHDDGSYSMPSEE